MIRSQDRSGWFGASDTNNIMGGWNTKAFSRFWLEKQGIIHGGYTSPAMVAGSHFEHRILDHLGIRRRDRQIKVRRYRLRVNLDGETSIIHEVKTYSNDFKVSTAYWRQAQVEMFAAVPWWMRLVRWVTRDYCIHKPLEIVAYRLLPEDHKNFFNPIDPDRITHHPIPYDPRWIEDEYLPRLRYLAKCLRRGRLPSIFPLEE